MNFKWCFYFLVTIAVVGVGEGWKLGNGLKYQLTTTILSRESGIGTKDVGFMFSGNFIVNAIWQDPNDKDNCLLAIEVCILYFGTL